jgi:hypothetical protein
VAEHKSQNIVEFLEWKQSRGTRERAKMPDVRRGWKFSDATRAAKIRCKLRLAAFFEIYASADIQFAAKRGGFLRFSRWQESLCSR